MEALGGSTSSAMSPAKFEEDEGNRPRDALPELQPSALSRSALPKGQLNEKSDELLVLVEGIEW